MVEIAGKLEVRDPNRTYVAVGDENYSFSKKVDALEIKAEIDRGNYALVNDVEMPNFSATSAMSMRQRNFPNGKNYYDALVDVLKQGRSVPRARQFIKQLIDVRDARDGKGVIYDANGNLIEDERLGDYYNVLFHNHWVWGAESFKKGKGHLGLDVVTISLDGQGKPVYHTEPLEPCLEEDCYAELDSSSKITT